MINKVFIIIAIICFGLAALALFAWFVLRETDVPGWVMDILAWVFVVGVPIGIICVTIGLVLLVLGV